VKAGIAILLVLAFFARSGEVFPETTMVMGAVPASGGSGEKKIKSKALVGHVNALCDESFQGRMTFNRGCLKAGRYIAAAFEKAGLDPLDGEGFLVGIPILLDVMDKDINIEGENRVFEMSVRRVMEEQCLAVMGKIPGRNPKMRDEIVLVVARYDGQGKDGEGNLYPGADRNASGVAAVLEIARALTRRIGGVHRTVVFAALPAGEEGVFMKRPVQGAEFERLADKVVKELVMSGEWDTFLESTLIRMTGLKGAEAFFVEPPVDVEKIRVVVDLNMLGRRPGPDICPESGQKGEGEESEKNPRLAVVGAETEEGLARIVERACGDDLERVAFLSFGGFRERGLKKITESFVFLKKRIPSLWITTGPVPEHGTVDDAPDKIDADQIEFSARIAYRLIRQLANEQRKRSGDQ